jgi:hypothetical protein
MKQIPLFETISAEDAKTIMESSQDGLNTWLSGIHMQAGIRNRNGREYPLSEISKAVQNARKTIEEHGGIFGELDHPQTLTINLDRISHVITEMRMDGNNAVGKVKLLNTPRGLIAKELVLNSGVKIGFSSRGAGQVSEQGGVSDFSYVTTDLVATPSAPGAMSEIVSEASLEGTKEGRRVLTLAEQVQVDIDAQKYFKKAILAYMDKMLISRK